MTVEDRLKQDLSHCESEIDRIRQEIGLLQAEERTMREKAVYIQSVLQDGAPRPDPDQRPLIKGFGLPQPRKLTLVQSAVQVLTAAGGRLKMDDIVDRIISAGLRPAATGEDREKLRANVSSILSHHARSANPKIVRSKKRGYYKLANASATAPGEMPPL